LQCVDEDPISLAIKRMISRKLNWISSIDPASEPQLKILEHKLSAFYSENPHYYGEIDFTADNWIDAGEAGYSEIVSQVKKSNTICEFGCGNANLLKHFPDIQSKYHGCDFSATLINHNKQKYPEAFFDTIKVPNLLPYADKMFDLVFSVFVLEHSTNPAKLLDECYRILKPGGKLIILCPDFMEQGRMSSQRAGWSEGNSKDKLKAGRYADALLTLFDNRIRIPAYCKLQQIRSRVRPQFLVNISPTVFEDRFYPDVDAVYITGRQEIIKYLEGRFTRQKNNDGLERYTVQKKIIFLLFIKN
jgi:SAM-dependent methyltransferase